MHKGRLEAFSDGVIAIIITIMVLELKVPRAATLEALAPLYPTFVSYVLSFVFVGIYWSNHHHLFQISEKVSGSILWANTHLLFWLSLIPFSTAWMGEHEFAQWPVALYGVNLICCAIAYYILAQLLIAFHGRNSKLAAAMGNDFKGKISVVIYLAGIAMTLVSSTLACVFYFAVSILWLVPDRRIEKIL